MACETIAGSKRTRPTGCTGIERERAMGIASLVRLSPEAKIRLPNVDEALNIGYAIHSADDPALRDKLTQENARLVANKFLALQCAPGSSDEAYLTSVRAI